MPWWTWVNGKSRYPHEVEKTHIKRSSRHHAKSEKGRHPNDTISNVEACKLQRNKAKK